MKRKVLSLLLTFCMALSLMPVQAFAAAEKTLTVTKDPTVSKITYGQTVNNSTFGNDATFTADGSAVTVTGDWAWAENAKTQKPEVGNTTKFDATFTPTGSDANTYKPVTVQLDVTVEPKELTVDNLNVPNRPYDGKTSFDVSTADATLTGKVAEDDDVKLPEKITGTIKDANASTTAKAVSFEEASITLEGTASKNYTLAKINGVEVTIDKADPDIGTVSGPADTTIYTSTDPKNVTLTRTIDTVAGTLEITDSAFTAGNQEYNWKFTPTDTTNYNVKTGKVTLTVAEDTLQSIEVTTQPTKKEYKVGETFEPAGMVVTATYASSKKEVVANDDKGFTSLTYKKGALAKGDTSFEIDYQGQKATVTLTINEDPTPDPKKDLEVSTAPTVNAVTYKTGLTLNDVAFATQGEVKTTDDQQTVAGTWAWETTDTTLKVGANENLVAVFTPADKPTEYNKLTTKVTVTVNKADAVTLDPQEVTYNKAATGEQTFDLTGLAMPKDAGTLSYTAVKSDDTDNKVITDASVKVDGSTLKYTLAGQAADAKATAKITVTVKSTNYADSKFVLTVKLSDKEAQKALTITTTNATFGQDLTLAVDGGTTSGKVTYVVTNGTGEATVNDQGVLHPVKAGNVSVVATMAGDGTHLAVSSAPTTITIAKGDQAALTLTATPNKAKVGEAVTLSVTGGSSAGAVTYALTDNTCGASVQEGKLTATQAGTVKVTATMAGNENYNDVTSTAVTVTFEPADTKPTTATVTFRVVNGYFSYANGQYQTVYQLAVNLTDGNGTLDSKYIPNVYPYPGYSYGRWDVTPNTTVGGITHDVTYTYYFQLPYYPPYNPNVPGSNGTVVNPDGSTTTTVTRPDGTRVETTLAPNGTKTEVVRQTNGTVMTTETRRDGTQVNTTTDTYGNTTSNVYVPYNVGETVVTVPTQKPVSGGTVAVIVNANGTETIVKDSVITGRGVALPVAGRATVKIRDNTKFFADVQSAGHWAADAVEFVTAREIFNGTGAGKFEPNAGMTRGMLAVALHNLENNPQGYHSQSFNDVASDAWYAEAVQWAASQGIVSGFGDGKFAPNEMITREQLAVMLYRYAKDPQASYTYLSFNDAGQVGGYAEEAVRWAVANGILTGKPGNLLDPQGNATRAEVAAMLQRFLNATVK